MIQIAGMLLKYEAIIRMWAAVVYCHPTGLQKQLAGTSKDSPDSDDVNKFVVSIYLPRWYFCTYPGRNEQKHVTCAGAFVLKKGG
ncbi:hypothetical protein [Chitinophaga solisilvae]|uniref:hypothetical protein n=1 Tax=Chitinophaga solisilvae TaxID=1233460 RepID=UPI00136DE4EB|nr:hypothetical protein [Chitinophaga solisilvae]